MLAAVAYAIPKKIKTYELYFYPHDKPLKWKLIYILSVSLLTLAFEVISFIRIYQIQRVENLVFSHKLPFFNLFSSFTG
jgi:hypothetical protein